MRPGNDPVPPGDPFAQHDAAYVLGALSAADRAAFEQHLDSCGSCARAVRELAGLPGLLARTDPAPAAPDSPPARVLPVLSAAARRSRNRRTAATLVAAAVAALACLALVLVLVLPAGDGGDATPMEATPMAVLGEYPVEASVAVTDTAAGSRIEMTCGYEGGRAWDYRLVVIPARGSADTVASWVALPGETVHLSVATRADRADIAAIEVRTSEGTPVLRLADVGP